MRKILLGLLVLIGGVSTSNAQSLLWEISGNGLTKSSYLFGTIHIQDKRVFNFNDSLKPKLEEVDELALELDMSQDNQMKIAMAMMLKDGKTLPDVLSPETYKKLGDLFKATTGQEITMYNTMIPFAIVSLLTQSKMKAEMPMAVDMFLASKAKELGKKTSGIETIDEQLSVMGDMSDEEISKFVDDFDESMEEEMETLIQAYLKADLAAVGKLMNEQDSYSKELMEELLDKRNIRMAERIGKRIKENSMLIGIGTAHLKGEVGVIDLLIKQGYTVKPIVANKSPWE